MRWSGRQDRQMIDSDDDKLAANKEGANKQFKPKIYQNIRRDQTRNFYDRCNYQNRYGSNS